MGYFSTSGRNLQTGLLFFALKPTIFRPKISPLVIKRPFLIQNNPRTTNGKVNETFWISREYYQLAKEYIDTKDDTFSVYSSDN